jgi:hypothetical protein
VIFDSTNGTEEFKSYRFAKVNSTTENSEWIENSDGSVTRINKRSEPQTVRLETKSERVFVVPNRKERRRLASIARRK